MGNGGVHVKYVGLFATSIVFLISGYWCLSMIRRREWKLTYPSWVRYTFIVSLAVMMAWGLTIMWSR
jgi:hypothetical protein